MKRVTEVPYDVWEVETRENPPYYHELTYYIDRQLTLDEWMALDDAFDEALEKVGLSDNAVGIAGPIPLGS